jgi:hypothetical protein
MVRDAGLSFQRNGGDFEGLVVVERLQDELVELFDIGGLAAVGGGCGGMVGLGVSLGRLHAAARRSGGPGRTSAMPIGIGRA